MRPYVFSILSLALTVILSLQASADTVVFKNGRSLDGVIKKETSTYIMLDMGVGSTKIMKSTIRRIERVSDDKRDDMQKEWMRNNPAHAKYAPAKYEDLAKEFRALQTARFDALKAGRYVGGYERINTDLAKKIEDMESSLEKAQDSLKITPPDQKETYSRIEKKISELEESITTSKTKLTNSAEMRTLSVDRINGYIDQVADFENSFAQSTEGYEDSSTKEEKLFVELIAEELATFKKDFPEKVVDPSKATAPAGPGAFPVGPGGPGGPGPFAPGGDSSPFAPIK